MAEGGTSSLALQAYFDDADPRLLPEIFASRQAKALGLLAPKWIVDQRPEMRRMLLEYIDDGLERPHHQPLIKRLFKLAEAKHDHEVMAHFLVSCDRLMQRRLKKRHRWDWQE